MSGIAAEQRPTSNIAGGSNIGVLLRTATKYMLSWRRPCAKRRMLCSLSEDAYLRRGGGHKKRFQYCDVSTEEEILDFRAIQGHSGENPMDPSLQDHVLIPDNFFEYIYHVGCHFNTHSIIESGLIVGGKKCQPGSTNGILCSRKSFGHALSRAERIRSDKALICCLQAKVESTPKCSVLDRNRTRSLKIKGLKFFQAGSNAINLHDTPTNLY